jgi:hypothetical protein
MRQQKLLLRCGNKSIVLLAASQLGEGLMINKAKLALIVAVAAHPLRSLDRSTAIIQFVGK